MADFDTYNSTYEEGKNTGNNAINAFNPTSQANSIRGGFDTLYNKNTNTIGNLSGAYSDAIKSNPSMTNLYSQANDIFGVPQLANNANRLNTQVTNQLPMQQNLMRGFDASQGQVDNAVNYNLRFLQPQATAATNAAQTAQNLAGQYVQAGLTQNQMNLLPIQYQAEATNEAMTRQATGYTTAAEQELQGLIAKMNAGVQLSQAEINRANQLAALDEAYNQAKTTATISAQNQILPSGSTYYNPATKIAYNPFTKVAKP